MNIDSAANSPLDLEELTERCMGRLELVERILGSFRNSLDEDLDQLEEEIASLNTEAIASRAHRIKGTSRTVSAHGLEQCAQRMEAAAAEGEMEAIEQSLKDMKLEFTRIGSAISRRNVKAVQ